MALSDRRQTEVLKKLTENTEDEIIAWINSQPDKEEIQKHINQTISLFKRKTK